MRIKNSLYAAVLLGFGMIAATSATAGQRTVVFATQVHLAAISSVFFGGPTGSPCLPSNVMVEPCRDWYGRAPKGTQEDRPIERDEYGLSYVRIGHYRYYQ
ncbi:MAG: hypothetical protein JXQ99_20210 [Hyphomicrobiaceae bacterium]